MNPLPMMDMQEATRLTREGRLMEAMALLRGAAPNGMPQARTSSSATKDQVDEATILDMRPPRIAGGAWTARRVEPGPGEQARPTPFQTSNAGAFSKVLHPAFGRTAMGRARADTQDQLVGGARFEDHTYADANGARSYKLYVPSRFAGEAIPLVVMLHGCTQSPDDFAAGTQMNALAEEQLFLVAYPAQPQSANAQKCWNWFNAGDQRRDYGEPALIAGITRQIMGEFPVDATRVYIAGLSAGGAAAAIMGSTYPDLFAAIGVHSGLACGAASDMPSAFSAMRQGGKGKRSGTGSPVPTIVFHGDRDTTVSAINGDQVIGQSRAGADLKIDVTSGTSDGGITYTRTRHSDRQDTPVLEQWVLHGAGHAWSGGSAAGSYTDPRGPDASREMMRFFMHHRGQPGVAVS
jgi:poly(hydroxyalkanoate) depolymerase family esterase